MRYFSIRPEVAGNIEMRSDADWKTHPPIVRKLHYEFEGWLGDAILEAFPCFIVTTELWEAIEQARLTGVRIDHAETSTSSLFRKIYPGRQLPAFCWLRPIGHAGADDFGISSNLVLIVSERALELLRRFGIEHADVEEFLG
jgi:hypothetical protein